MTLKTVDYKIHYQMWMPGIRMTQYRKNNSHATLHRLGNVQFITNHGLKEWYEHGKAIASYEVETNETLKWTNENL